MKKKLMKKVSKRRPRKIGGFTLYQGRKLLRTVDAGLTCGLGRPKPGEMCVEAAICYALGIPHSDQPPCVEPAVRSFKISLNDRQWSSKKARAAGLRRVALAQLGSAGVVDGKKFTQRLAELTIRHIVPVALLAVAKLVPAHAAALEVAATRCTNEGTKESAWAARDAANAARKDASSDAASAAAYAAASAANKGKKRDEIYTQSAELAVQVLRELKSPGIKLMDRLCPLTPRRRR